MKHPSLRTRDEQYAKLAKQYSASFKHPPNLGPGQSKEDVMASMSEALASGKPVPGWEMADRLFNQVSEGNQQIQA